MAQITDLPEEVIIMIVRILDFSSLCSMYNSCKFFKNVLSLYCVVLECNMSLSLVATVNTLRLDFFKDISKHLLVLNMRGVPDLSKTKVLPAFKKLKCLKVLDISYTNLTILDLMAIHKVCPTLKDITVDFVFDKTCVVKFAEKTLQQYQSLFEHFENVHFVGSVSNLLYFTSAFHVLKKSKLDTLKFSVIKVDNMHIIPMENYDCEVPHFNHFAIYLMDWRSTNAYECPGRSSVISMIDPKNYEFCIISSLDINDMSKHASVYTTPIFKKFFSEHFNVDTECVPDFNRKLTGNVALLIWNKETTQFDDMFFHKLYSRVKPYFTFYYEALSDVRCPQNYDWIITEPKTSSEIIIYDDEYCLKDKRRKTNMPNLIIDYDHLLKDKLKAQLSLVFKSGKMTSVSLPCNGQYLSKITFLSLSGGAVKYNISFFSDLFKYCCNLVTLSVETPTLAACRYSYEIVNAIKASQSVKNLRLVDKGMDFKQFFDSLSKCETLENIILVDLKHPLLLCQIADPTLLIESCAKLYSVYIEAPFAESAQSKQLQWFNKVKITFNRPHLRAVVINRVCNNTYYNHGYDPFVDVFKLNPIKPID